MSIQLNEQFWQLISMVPRGKIATYGQIATLAGYPNHARAVGSTLKKLPNNTKIPWYRIVNS